MNVLYDHQIFIFQKYGGISRYFFELMREFQEKNPLHFDLSLSYSDNHYLKDADFFTNSPFLSCRHLPCKKKIRRFVNTRHSVRALKGQQFDVFHPTYYDPYFLPAIGTKPYVITVHDMVHELFPDMFQGDPTARNKKELIERSTRIIAVSNNTKRDIIALYGIDEERIEVVYHGSSLKGIDASYSAMELPRRFVLFVGARWPYKNFLNFLKSIAMLMKRDRELQVICAGGRPFSAEEREIIHTLGITERIYHYPVSDDFLVHLYQNALAFVMPSLYEGFGIPVLEAFNCGCPVIVSNSSALPEVAGDAAVYLEPEDQDSIRDAIEKVIYDEALRKRCIEKGYARVQQFSWERTAEQTRSVYERLL